MNPDTASGEKDGNGIFTDKQCRVLDLLIEHKTSKEIARALRISPYTVDQRISLARAKLGVSSRNELAARYRAMLEAPGQPASACFELSGWEQSNATRDNDADALSIACPGNGARPSQARRDDALTAFTAPFDEQIPCPTPNNFDYRVGPEVFEGSSGGLWRLGAVVATALLLVVTILGLFAIFNQLNDMLS